MALTKDVIDVLRNSISLSRRTVERLVANSACELDNLLRFGTTFGSLEQVMGLFVQNLRIAVCNIYELRVLVYPLLKSWQESGRVGNLSVGQKGYGGLVNQGISSMSWVSR